ncbi:MAG TPA: hypothetical protein VGJ16_00060, partial [Pirellulales bacterium]
FRQAIRLSPNHATFRANLARTLDYLNQHAEAEAEAQEAVRLDPQTAFYQHGLGWALAKGGKLELAEQAYREELRLREASRQLLAATTHEHFGCVLWRLGKKEEAEQQFAEAQRREASYASHAQLGDWRAREGLFWEAALEYSLDTGPQLADHRAPMRAALLMLLSGDRSGYERVCCEMLARADNLKEGEAIRRTVHVCLFAAPPIGQPEQRQRLTQAFVANRGTIDVHSWREQALVAYRAGQWQEAVEACQRSRDLAARQSLTGNYRAQALAIEAMALHRLDRNVEARAAYYLAAETSQGNFPYAPGHLGVNWVDWVIYELARREAAEVLGIHDEPYSRAVLARANAAAADGDWKSAARDYVRLCRSGGTDSNQWQKAAAALLLAEDGQGYERLCREMVERFAGSHSLYDDERVIKTCLLRPSAVEVSKLPLAGVIRTLIDKTIPAPLAPWAMLACSLAKYRDGHWESAGELAEQANRDSGLHTRQRAMGLLIMAMAAHRQGQAQAATAHLAEANKIMDAAVPRLSDGTIVFHRLLEEQPAWLDWLNAEILRREAAALLAVAPPKT